MDALRHTVWSKHALSAGRAVSQPRVHSEPGEPRGAPTQPESAYPGRHPAAGRGLALMP